MKTLVSAIILLFSALTMFLSGCDARATPPGTGQPGKAAEAGTPVFFPEQPIDDVQELLGEPNGRMVAGNQTILLYGKETLSFVEGKWSNYQPDIRKRIADGKKALAKKTTEKKSATWEGGVASTGTQGEYGNLVSPGSVTVVNFYTTWHGSCKKMAPILDELICKNPEVTLSKVDIVDLKSSVAKKYNVTTVPSVRVFDKNGRMVGIPTSSPTQVARYIEQAKRNK